MEKNSELKDTGGGGGYSSGRSGGGYHPYSR